MIRLYSFLYQLSAGTVDRVTELKPVENHTSHVDKLKYKQKLFRVVLCSIPPLGLVGGGQYS